MSLRTASLSALVLAVVAAPSSAQEGPVTPAPSADDQLVALLDEDLDALMERWPTWASVRGDRRFDDRLADVSPAAEERWVEQARARLARVRALDARALSPRNLVNAELLTYELEQRVAGARFREWLEPITQVGGPQQSFPQLPERLTFTSREQLEGWAKRLDALPAHLEQVLSNMRAGLAEKRTPPRLVMARAAEQCRAQATGEPREHRLFAPFKALPTDDAVASRALRATTRAMATFTRLAEFLEREYVPACRESIAATARPDGAEYYAHCLAEHSTLPLSAEEIHATGRAEVARIQREMLEVVGRAKFTKDGLEGQPLVRAFIEHLRGDPRSYCKTADELLARYRDVAKRIDPELPKLFGKLPRNTYGVRAMPEFIAPSSPTAYYYSGSIENGTPGFFVANTHRLDQRPTYEMVPLTLHEAVPGHHLQISLAHEMTDLPKWRSLAGYTAYVEGWALYAERLGLEMGEPGSRGLYADPVDDFGRLSYEMWRALRLVVDTGLHAMGWSRQEAIDYMLEHSALTPENVEREVDRYVAWPGQAVGYKLGELKIRALRAQAEEELGARFDLRAFHDLLLGEGAVPLGVLERMVERWIAARK